MLYLLDSNVLIDAARDYYPFDMVPEFWQWLEHQGTAGVVKVPIEMYEEVTEGSDTAADWLRLERVKMALKFAEEVDPAHVARVVSDGYATDLTDDEVQRIGRDPFLVAHALASSATRCVVTTEVSKPSRKRANRKLPDVCSTLTIQTCNTFELTKRLQFRTNWQG
jgi:hypothetical protein